MIVSFVIFWLVVHVIYRHRKPQSLLPRTAHVSPTTVSLEHAVHLRIETTACNNAHKILSSRIRRSSSVTYFYDVGSVFGIFGMVAAVLFLIFVLFSSLPKSTVQLVKRDVVQPIVCSFLFRMCIQSNIRYLGLQSHCRIYRLFSLPCLLVKLYMKQGMLSLEQCEWARCDT